MKQKGLALIAIIILGVFVGLVCVNYFGGLRNNKTSNVSLSTKTAPTPVVNHGYTLFSGLFQDTKYGFSFNLPSYYGRYGGWSSNNSWEKDANPDYLDILPLENAKEADAVFITGPEGFSIKDLTISVSKNTTIDKWRGTTRTAFNSKADGWGSDHKFINQNYLSTYKDINVLKFSYLDMVAIPQTENDYDTDNPVTGIAVQKGSDVLVISMAHPTKYQSEVDILFTQILSSLKFK